jgi:nucleoid DNA-binding protein
MITSIIIRALLEENSVIITGLGTFYVKKLPSQVKEDIVYPPQNIIEFEYSNDIEGFDFVSKLSKWEQIRIDEAQAQVSEWLNLLEQGLEHNKSVFFDNFGTFSKEPSGKVVFQSMLVSQLNVENEGLEPVYILSQKGNQIHQSADEPVIDKRNVLVKKTKKRDKFWFALTITATAILLVALFFKDTISQFYQTVFVKNETVVVIEDEDTDNTAYISNIEEDVATITITEKTENQKTPAVSLPESNDIHLPYREGKFYVIAGSFTRDEDALRHIKEKKLEKYHAKIVVQPQNPRKRVCIGVFDNEKDAENFAAQIDKNYWVLK